MGDDSVCEAIISKRGEVQARLYLWTNPYSARSVGNKYDLSFLPYSYRDFGRDHPRV